MATKMYSVENAFIVEIPTATFSYPLESLRYSLIGDTIDFAVPFTKNYAYTDIQDQAGNPFASAQDLFDYLNAQTVTSVNATVTPSGTQDVDVVANSAGLSLEATQLLLKQKLEDIDFLLQNLTTQVSKNVTLNSTNTKLDTLNANVATDSTLVSTMSNLAALLQAILDETPFQPNNLDAFGRLQTSLPNTQLDLKTLHDKMPLKIDEVVNGTATSTWDSATNRVVMNVLFNNDYVIRKSFEYGYYQSGKGMSAVITFDNFQPQTNVIKRVGYFDSTLAAPYASVFDGIFLESDGTEVALNVYADGSLTDSVPQGDWNDPLDGSGPSGVTVDWSKGQIVYFDFQWLAKGTVRFFMVFNGVKYLIHSLHHSNLIAAPYMNEPNHPIRWEIRSIGGNGTFNCQCASIMQDNGTDISGNSIGIPLPTAPRSAPSTGVRYLGLAVRLKAGWEDVTTIMQSLNVLCTTNDNYLIEVRLNPTISVAPVYTGITNAALEYSFGTGQTVSGGYVLYSDLGLQTKERGFNVQTIRRLGSAINGTCDVMAFCITPLSASMNYHIAANFIEIQ